MQGEHIALNKLCDICGNYGNQECAECMVEIFRQRAIIQAMKRKTIEQKATEQREPAWA